MVIKTKTRGFVVTNYVHLHKGAHQCFHFCARCVQYLTMYMFPNREGKKLLCMVGRSHILLCMLNVDDVLCWLKFLWGELSFITISRSFPYNSTKRWGDRVQKVEEYNSHGNNAIIYIYLVHFKVNRSMDNGVLCVHMLTTTLYWRRIIGSLNALLPFYFRHLKSFFNNVKHYMFVAVMLIIIIVLVIIIKRTTCQP